MLLKRLEKVSVPLVRRHIQSRPVLDLSLRHCQQLVRLDPGRLVLKVASSHVKGIKDTVRIVDWVLFAGVFADSSHDASRGALNLVCVPNMVSNKAAATQ